MGDEVLLGVRARLLLSLSEIRKEEFFNATLANPARFMWAPAQTVSPPEKPAFDWKRFWELFSAPVELNPVEQMELSRLKHQLHEIHAHEMREEKRKAEELVCTIQTRLAQLGINDSPNAYVIHRPDYKRGSEKEREYVRLHRNFLFRIHDNRCSKCGNDANGLDIDHFFISKNEGGCFQMIHRDGFYVNNATPLCESCNRSKSDKHFREFFSPQDLVRILALNAKMNERLNQHKLARWKKGEPMSTLQVTKSEYCAGIQCPKRLYYQIHDPDIGLAPSDDLQMRFQMGQEVGKIARQRFPSGTLVGATGSALPYAIAKTKTLIEALQTEAIFEAAVQFENFVARVDILKNNFDGSWDLIEVKSSSELKEEYLEDVAFQTWVLQNSGIKLRKIFLSHINNTVVFPDLTDFFTDCDLTEAVNLRMPSFSLKLKSFLEMLEKPDAPEIRIGRQCANPYGCEFKSHCWADVPKGSTLELYNYRKRKPTKFELFHEGPKLIQDLKDEVELTRFQQIQYLASKVDHPIVDRMGLAEFLGKVLYPIYYFDFETIAPAVPFLNGMRPYQRIPVQFSCHIQRGPHSGLEHHEFLASGEPGSDPRQECLDAMKAIFTTPGTIIAYHDDFERSLIREMADYFVKDSDFLMGLESSFWDLEDAFQHHFYHKKFGGSVSIKKVLPYFAPEMSYDKLAIQNGGQAQAALMSLLRDGLSEIEREKLRRDLLAYCHQDSLAMVVIHQKLMEVIGGNLKLLRTV